ncbi:RNA polymerase factor sigma-54 [Bacillus carboniphilus]|uniref:RNA polymerase factor sigma-54 n=1 Tax=Bacillus carboniphilus TaxID=86663 RepID=A0ABY9JPW6_9BACI|nr:RNA polymerase factor sigma-54 [Bacillus carboniphilus]WLR41426.1 RNA polymerase factor sigma-54 [Bacillus carboniphilus]
MDMKAGLYQEQTLKLTLSTEMQQAISLLQYPSLQLYSYLEQLSIDNPLIEVEQTSEIFYHKRETSRKQEEGTLYDPPVFLGSSLQESLYEQLLSFSLTKEQNRVITILIDSLDENGYIDASIEQLQKRFHLCNQILTEGLTLLQSLEPAGIGARDLQECLYLQLKRKKKIPKELLNLIKEYFDPFVNKSWNRLKRDTGISIEKLQRYFHSLKELDPKPGSKYTDQPPIYVIPDVLFEERHGQWSIIYNDRFLPKMTLNNDYDVMRQTDEECRSYLLKKYQQFQHLHQGLAYRRLTILKVMESIVQRQLDFFLMGNNVLKPLTMKEVAEQLEVHESTVSRAVKDKYVQTPYGLRKMKSFFTNKIEQENGIDATSSRIKEMIQIIVQQEDKKKPLSDQKMVDIIQGQYYIEVSRRTIAKYREQLKIPSSQKRKEY